MCAIFPGCKAFFRFVVVAREKPSYCTEYRSPSHRLPHARTRGGCPVLFRCCANTPRCGVSNPQEQTRGSFVSAFRTVCIPAIWPRSILPLGKTFAKVGSPH